MSLFGWFRKPKRVLIIDDEPDIADSIKARLRMENYEVETAGDGEEGVQKAKVFRPDLIILDVMMPRMDGVEACYRLKDDRHTKNIPVLVLTALPKIRDAESAFGAGAEGFLNKPFSNDRLIQKVAELID